MEILKRSALFAVICLSISSTARGDVTYTYTGNLYTSIQDSAPPVGIYTTLMSVQGSFTVASALAPNLVDFNFIPNSWLVSDGRNSFDETNGFYTPNTLFKISTDASGNISGWYLNLETDDNVFIRRLHSAFNTGMTGVEEDYGWISIPPAQVDIGSNSGSHGSWSAVPEPTSPFLLAGIASSAFLKLRRRRTP